MYIFQFGGLEQIKGFYKSAAIEVCSKERPNSKEILSGEALRFELRNVESDPIFWIFDEKKAEKGSIETEYVFGFDEKGLNQAKIIHRVDAFYRDGDVYRSVCKRICVTNMKVIAILDQKEKKIEIAIQHLGNALKLSSFSLACYREGRFSSINRLPINKIDMDDKADINGIIKTTTLTYLPKVYQSILDYIDYYPNTWALIKIRDMNKGDLITLAQPIALASKVPPKNFE